MAKKPKKVQENYKTPNEKYNAEFAEEPSSGKLPTSTPKK